MISEEIQAIQSARPTITIPAGVDLVKLLGMPRHMIEASKPSYSSIQLDASMMTREERALAKYLFRTATPPTSKSPEPRSPGA